MIKKCSIQILFTAVSRPTNFGEKDKEKIKTQKPQPWEAVISTVANQNKDMVTKQPVDGVTETSTEDPVLSNKHIVVIVSYMRSGSTLTADILQHSQGTVYVFEPFHSVIVRTRQRQPLLYLNGTTRYVTVSILSFFFSKFSWCRGSLVPLCLFQV